MKATVELNVEHPSSNQQEVSTFDIEIYKGTITIVPSLVTTTLYPDLEMSLEGRRVRLLSKYVGNSEEIDSSSVN